jgi:hypothetical protein
VKSTKLWSEHLVEKFLSIPIIEAGSERMMIRDYAMDRSETIIFHLMCILSEPQQAAPWKEEIDARFREIQRKTARRLHPNFSKDEYLAYLTLHLADFGDLVGDYLHKFKKPLADPDAVRHRIEAVLDQAAEMLANGTRPTSDLLLPPP